MKKRNLILIALAMTLLLVFTQIGTMASGDDKCVIVPGGTCPVCPIIRAVSCHAGDLDCGGNYWSCCNWARGRCFPENVFDNTNCGQCCG